MGVRQQWQVTASLLSLTPDEMGGTGRRRKRELEDKGRGRSREVGG